MAAGAAEGQGTPMPAAVDYGAIARCRMPGVAGFPSARARLTHSWLLSPRLHSAFQRVISPHDICVDSIHVNPSYKLDITWASPLPSRLGIVTVGLGSGCVWPPVGALCVCATRTPADDDRPPTTPRQLRQW